MPLTRDRVTAASRVMLPAYAVFFAVIGSSLLFTPEPRLLATPAFHYADELADLSLWGLGFLAVAAGMTVAMVVGSRALFQYLLAAMIVWMGGFALMTLAAAFYGQATYAAWAWPAFVAVACWASLVSLSSGEIGEPR